MYWDVAEPRGADSSGTVTRVIDGDSLYITGSDMQIGKLVDAYPNKVMANMVKVDGDVIKDVHLNLKAEAWGYC